MSLPAIVESTELVDPRTGELVSDPPRVAELVRYFRDQRRAYMDQIKAGEWLLVQEAERQGTRTFPLGDLTVEVKEDREIVWDLEILERLREMGLPEERWSKLVTEEISYKVNANVAKQIAGANPQYAEVIGRARTDHSKGQRVYVR